MEIDGIEVINAVSDDQFEVTQEDADNGIPRDHHKCSIALGWRRFDPVAQEVIVGKDRAYKLTDRFGYLKWVRYQVSRAIKMQEAILDNGGHLSPGIYTLKAPTKSVRKPGQQGSDKDPNRPKPESTLVKDKRIRRAIPMRANNPTRST